MYIVADIGGTNMRVAGSDDLSRLGTPVVLDTPHSYAEGVSAFTQAAHRIASGAPIAGVAVGVKGVLAEDKRSIITAPQNILHDWKGKPLATDIGGALDAPVVLENDTALCGLGEVAYGAGKGAHIVVYITVSTGVNGARLIDGRIDAGRAEIGGQYLMIDGVPRSLEELVSGAAIAEKYGVHPKEIDTDSPLWEELARVTAFGVHNAILHWSPDLVVLGGSMFNKIGISVPRVQEHVRHLMRKFPQTPPLVHAALGDVGGLWGGMALQRTH